MTKYNIGCGLITCDRQDFFKKSLSSLQNAAQKLNFEYVVVNDGLEKILNCIETGGKRGVAVAKNIALNHLIKKKCEHIFLIEDDIEIKDFNVFLKYIEAYESTGIKHFNYGMHGNHNKDPQNNPIVRKTINYPNNCKIDLYPNVLGAFSYYHIDCLDAVGLMNEQYYNALEHVDHSYKIIQKNLHPPFRWFADIHDSQSYLNDIVPDHQQSKIRNDKDFQENFAKALDLFIKEHGFSVVFGYGPTETSFSEKECLEKLKIIWKNFQKEKSE